MDVSRTGAALISEPDRTLLRKTRLAPAAMWPACVRPAADSGELAAALRFVHSRGVCDSAALRAWCHDDETLQRLLWNMSPLAVWWAAACALHAWRFMPPPPNNCRGSSAALALHAARTDSQGRLQIARDPRCPAGILAEFTHLLLAVPSEAAANPAFRPAALVRLATDPRPEVRRGVALNPACPASALVLLAADAREMVRYAAARNPSADHERRGPATTTRQKRVQ